MTRGVGAQVVTAFGRQTFEAFHVGLADTASAQLNQNLIGLERRQFEFFNAQVERTMQLCTW